MVLIFVLYKVNTAIYAYRCILEDRKALMKSPDLANRYQRQWDTKDFIAQT